MFFNKNERFYSIRKKWVMLDIETTLIDWERVTNVKITKDKGFELIFNKSFPFKRKWVIV